MTRTLLRRKLRNSPLFPSLDALNLRRIYLTPFVVAVAWLIVCPMLHAQVKSPVPDEALWREASKLLAPRLGAICSAAKTTAERAELAKRLLVMGQNATDVVTVRYILLD